MATKALPGFSGLLYASTAPATTSANSTTLVQEFQDGTFSFEMAEMNATSKDSGAWDEFLPGIRKWGMSGKCLYNDVVGSSSGATGQSFLQMSVLGQTKIGITFRATSSSGIMNWIGNGFVTKFDVTSPLTAPNEFAFTFRGTGSISQGPSTS